MTFPSWQDSLAEVERLLDSTGQLLVRGDAQALERECAALRQAMVLLSQASRAAPRDPALDARLAQVSMQLGHQRQAMGRRGALADRALAAVLPQMDRPTYAAPASAQGFKGSVARLYAGAAP